jgi:hypothetical protein
MSFIENCCFVLCSSPQYAGALKTRIPTNVSNCFFDRCKVEGGTTTTTPTRGGAIEFEPDTVTYSLYVLNCVFSDCFSGSGGGGAISYRGIGPLTIENTTFLSCACYGTFDGYVGGGLLLFNKGVYCKNCSWLNGRSDILGGAIGENYSSSSTITATDVVKLEACVFVSNFCPSYAGAVDLKTIRLECVECVFSHNSAVGGSAVVGDLIYNYSFNKSVFVGNIVGCPGWEGGVLFLSALSTGKLVLTDCIFLKTVNPVGCANSL